jgi:hypothetical protein
VTMSFINIIKKNRGPRIDPGGTPALIGRHLECALSIITRCLEIRSDIALRNLFSQQKSTIVYIFQLFNNIIY